MKKVFWLIGGFLAFVAYKKYTMSKLLQFTVGGISTGCGLLQPELTLTLNITNPTNTTADIQSINAAVLINGLQVGTINTNKLTTIKGQTTTGIDIPIVLNLENVISDIAGLVQGNFMAQINGTLHVDFIPLPISLNYSL